MSADSSPLPIPSDPDTLVRVSGVSKKFCLSLKKSLWYGLCDMGRELTGRRRGSGKQGSEGDDRAGLRPKEFWAVNNVSFELKRGECLGLIGRNGAGKTTLLKMLNGLIKPDAGRIEMRGRVGALIALGAGFNPVLTGRENIYVNGSVLGLNKKEIDAKLDEIVDFAEIGEFIDTPVQNYSSGMAVRLGFAVAAVLIEPDILLLDEVLAVGDMGFKIKCLNAVKRMMAKAAVIFVSHSMEFISQFCTRILVLKEGNLELDTVDTSEAIDLYYSLFPSAASVAGAVKNAVEHIVIHTEHDTFNSSTEATIQQGEKVQLSYDLYAPALIGKKIFTAGAIKDMSMLALIHFMPEPCQNNPIQIVGERMRITFDMGPMYLNAGKYLFVIYVSDAETGESIARVEGVSRFRVASETVHWGKMIQYVRITTRKMVVGEEHR